MKRLMRYHFTAVVLSLHKVIEGKRKHSVFLSR